MRPRDTHLLYCARCHYATPHAQRADLQVPPDAPGLMWQCATCGHAAPRSPAVVYTSPRLES